MSMESVDIQRPLFRLSLPFSHALIAYIVLFLIALIFSFDRADYGNMVAQIALITSIIMGLIYQKKTSLDNSMILSNTHVISLLLFIVLFLYEVIQIDAMGLTSLTIRKATYIFSAIILASTIIGSIPKTLAQLETLKVTEINLISVIIGTMVALLIINIVKISELYFASLGFGFSMELVIFLTIAILFYAIVHYLIQCMREFADEKEDRSMERSFVVKVQNHPWQPFAEFRELLELITRIEEELETKHLYLHPAVSLEMLSEKTNIPKYRISRILHEHFDKGFYQLIGEYRVRHAMMLLGSKQNISLEGLSELCGFNSKTTFYKYFKQVNGCTPHEFVQKLHPETHLN